jgi:predicted enzyme related to lactoylglutathione lyase
VEHVHLGRERRRDGVEGGDAGGAVVVEPFDVMDAGRMAVFTDPEGAAFCVWQAKANKGARIVNEHGSLNFNGLNTRDVAGAKSFYAAVFSWRTLTLDGGAQMWTLPGYGDHLERDNPDLRKQMEEAGAPKGFEDVVASINPIPDDQPDTPPHWSVTFAVDDADATAARATELGGKAIVSPFDAPWVRITVISDPQGATFIASKFVPENRTSEASWTRRRGPPRGAMSLGRPSGVPSRPYTTQIPGIASSSNTCGAATALSGYSAQRVPGTSAGKTPRRPLVPAPTRPR